MPSGLVEFFNLLTVYNFSINFRISLLALGHLVIGVRSIQSTTKNPVSNGGVFAFSTHLTPSPDSNLLKT